MFKRQRNNVVLTLCLATGGSMLSLPTNAASNNLDNVLNALARQQSSASDLVKSARQPTSLALTSQLVSQNTQAVSNDKDVLQRLSAVASNTVSKFSQTGVASWYGRQFHGKKTASGDVFDQNGLTAAHRSLPMNCYVKVTNKSNGKSVVVKVNDRGPFSSNRVMDLSYGAAKQIGLVNAGSGNVIIERVAGPN
ncbi:MULTISPECIES: septal ring lytic transglycosylase RlpA family protein [unclassified Moraxella]|uniref:septal ring lytic transglycosylase RlpA family protein n=1 Tax=unclassified Moraxella TaxID=2685852 RepID=UPI003AF5626E